MDPDKPFLRPIGCADHFPHEATLIGVGLHTAAVGTWAAGIYFQAHLHQPNKCFTVALKHFQSESFGPLHGYIHLDEAMQDTLLDEYFNSLLPSYKWNAAGADDGTNILAVPTTLGYLNPCHLCAEEGNKTPRTKTKYDGKKAFKGPAPRSGRPSSKRSRKV